MLERLNHLALKALDTLDGALAEPGLVGVNAAKTILEWRWKVTEEEVIKARIEALERRIKERKSIEQQG